jgi:hypothetical protein
MMKVNIKGFGELEFPDGTSEEQMKASINSAIASGALKPQVEENIEPQKEYTPPELKYNLDDPQELAQAISQKEGVSYEEAYERVAGKPRSERANYEGANFPLASNIADVVTLPYRSLAGLSSVFSGEDPLDRMAKPVSEDENPYTGFLGNMANDAFSYTPTGVAKLGGQALANSPKLMQGIKEGVVAGLGEYGLSEYQKEEEGIETGNGLGTGLLQSAIGGVAGGAFGKFADMANTKKSMQDSPNILRQADEAERIRPDDNIELDYSGEGLDQVKESDILEVAFKNPKQYRERIIKDVMEGTGFSKKQAESVPPYARGMFANIDEQGKKDLNKYIMQADLANSGNRNAMTPYEQVGQMFVDGKNAIDKARSEAGSTMGDVERKYLSGSEGGVFDGAIRTDDFKNKWSDLMAEYGGMIREIGEDGKVTYVSTPNKKMVPPSMRKDFQEIDDEINELGDFVTGEYLRSVEQNMSEIMRSGSGVSTRMGKMNTKADVATNKMIQMGRELVGDQIEAKGGKEARDLYNNARKDYAKYWNAQDFIQRRLGKGIADEETGEVATRGGSMVQAMLNNNQDRNTKTLARMINNLTGEDIGKHATMAKFAMQSIGDKRGGAGGSLLKSKGEYLSKAIDWGVDKVSRKGFGKDSDGMMSMAISANPNQTPSILEQAGDNPYISSVGKTFSNFLQPKVVRAGGRNALGTFSGEQESNKVTEKPIGGIGAEKIRQGMGQ